MEAPALSAFLDLLSTGKENLTPLNILSRRMSTAPHLNEESLTRSYVRRHSRMDRAHGGRDFEQRVRPAPLGHVDRQHEVVFGFGFRPLL
jgi:hypothetical protein